MTPAMLTARILVAPPRLIAGTRVTFRSAALEALERCSDEGASATFAIEMGETHEIDASGLGVLVLLRKRARERGLSTTLLHVRSDVHALLDMTNLSTLFSFE